MALARVLPAPPRSRSMRAPSFCSSASPTSAASGGGSGSSSAWAMAAWPRSIDRPAQAEARHHGGGEPEDLEVARSGALGPTAP